LERLGYAGFHLHLPTHAAAPVDPSHRISSIDAIRGTALLGILVINIVGFAQPVQSLEYPTVAGGFGGANFVLWCVNDLLAEGKMRGIFSMLFGASVILFTMAKATRFGSEEIADLYYRRTIWLIVFGILHAYLLWPGDILFEYGVTGLLLYPLRKVAPKRLLLAGILFLAVFSLKNLVRGLELRDLRDRAAAAAHAATGGQPVNPEDRLVQQRWQEEIRAAKPGPEEVAEMTRIRRSNYWTLFQWRLGVAKRIQTTDFYEREFWDVCGMMLIGVALFKLGVFSATRTRRQYAVLAVSCYAIGLPLGLYLMRQNIVNDFDPAAKTLLATAHQLVRLTVALGHVAVLAILCQSRALPWLTSRLAAVGQTALSNYILDTILCSMIFYGYGLALYGRMDRVHYFLVTLAICTFQLIASRIWLTHFRFGPVEWLWRSLTYWSPQPMRFLRSDPTPASRPSAPESGNR
jgi:uncharacterized protein